MTGRPTLTDRQHALLAAALALAGEHGYDKVSRRMVGDAVGLSESALSWHWTADEFRAAVMERAVRERNLVVVAQGLVNKHPVALAAPVGVRRAAAGSLV
jgi:AcrR family transcriptional regulator